MSIPFTEPRKLRSPVRVRLKHGSKDKPLSEAQTKLPLTLSVPPDPSTHVNVNSLPVTKRSAASAFMFCARAGPLATKLATKATHHAIIPIALQIPSQRLRNQPLITRFRTSVPNFHPRSTGEQVLADRPRDCRTPSSTLPK